jgi:hypothetical protein
MGTGYHVRKVNSKWTVISQAWEQTEEDTIIAMLQETRATNFCDPKFTADNNSLYRDSNYVPDYDAHAPGPIRWV